MSRVAAVVLAAGEASRFGSAKQLLLLPRVLPRLAAASDVDEIVVVEGAYTLREPCNTVLRGPPCRVVTCSEWAKGPGASLRCGLAALDDDVAATVVVLADGPTLAPAAVDRLVDAWRERGAAVLAASYGGVRGHPLVLAREAWHGVPDDGLRAQHVVLVPCDDLGAPGDVDYPEDWPT